MPDDLTPEPGPAVEGEIVDPKPEATAPVEQIDSGYTPGGVPTFDAVREKIETRYGTAIGASELAGETPEGRSVAEQYDERQRAAAERLAQIREQMRKQSDDSQ